MKPDNIKTGVVIECYNDTPKHRVVVIQSEDKPRMYHFLYVPNYPDINFGDYILMNFVQDIYHLHRGNPKLTYRLHPIPFPSTLLAEIMSEYLN